MIARLRSAVSSQQLVSPAGIALTGFVIAVISLLANNPGIAIVIASLVIPAVLLTELPRRDLVEDEPRWGSLAVLGWGIAVGIVIATVASAISAEWWVKGAALHVGAAGFGGEAADAAGAPGVGVLLFNGILLPALAVALAAIGAYAMRRYAVYRNEVMDGVTLGVAAGCGLATGSTIIFVWPMLSGTSITGGSVADWTALLFGVLVTRPVIFALVVSSICAGIWHVSLSQRSLDLLLPAAIGLSGAVIFAIGDMLVQPSGTRVELGWHVIVGAALLVASSLVLRRSLAQDRSLTKDSSPRVLCHCGASTPEGTFCAACGGALALVAPVENSPDLPENERESQDPTIPV
jgi:hypothetical protein